MTTDARVFDLVHWISEREAIRQRREAGAPPPWASDPVMETVRFTNVRREDDRTTRWIATHWRNDNVGHPYFLKAMVLARLVNYIDTLDEIKYPEDWDMVEYTYQLRTRAARGDKVWTSAYTISTCGRPVSKEVYVCQLVDSVPNNLLVGVGRLSVAHELLMGIKGLGSFLAAQVLADLKNTPGHPLQTARDWWDWCAPGPGSVRGLNAFYGRPQAQSIGRMQFDAQLRSCYQSILPYLPDYVGRLHMQDFQNCLCEFSKYMRVKYAGGRARNRYVAR